MKPIGWTWHGWIFSLGWIVASQALHSAAADPPVVTSPAGDSPIDEELRNEILQMAEADQRFRMAEIKARLQRPAASRHVSECRRSEHPADEADRRPVWLARPVPGWE